jgi:hypothetical protein
MRGETFHILLKGVLSVYIPIPMDKVEALIVLFVKQISKCEGKPFVLRKLGLSIQINNVTVSPKTLKKLDPRLKALDSHDVDTV